MSTITSKKKVNISTAREERTSTDVVTSSVDASGEIKVTTVQERPCDNTNNNNNNDNAENSDCVGDVVVDADLDDSDNSRIDDNSGFSPLHYAVSCNNVVGVEALLKEGVDPNQVDDHGRRPLYYSIHDRSATALLLRYGSGVCEHMDWESKQKLLETAFRKLRSEDDQQVLLALLRDCMDDINAKSIERRTVTMLMTWLYGKCFLLWCYVYLAAAETSESLNNNLFVYKFFIYLISVAVAFFELLEVRHLVKTGAEFVYLRDTWKWINWITLVLTLVTTTMLHRGRMLRCDEGDTMCADVEDFQVLVMVTIAFLCVSVLGDLKTMFLPFSIFVGGVTQICWDLIPFLTVTVIVLLAFSMMYYIKGPGTYGVEDQSFEDAFFFVFSGFAGGLDEVNSFLDVIFGVVLVIILFNVVIAIVSSSWQTAVNASFINLCKHRVELIRRTEIDRKNEELFLCTTLGLSMTWLDKELWIDRIDDNWSSWEKKARRSQFPGQQSPVTTYFQLSVNCLKALFIVILGILGLVTFGILFPTRIRKQLFQIYKDKNTMGMNVEHIVGSTEMMGNDIKSLGEKMYEQNTTMEARIEKLETKLDDMTSKLDMVLEYMQSQAALS